MKPYLLFVCLLVNSLVFSQQPSLANLRCEYNTSPLGVETPHPKFSWEIVSGRKNVLQSAYRILVSENATALTKNIGDVWDSKKVNSGESIQVPCEGKALKPAKTYYWKVMVWDDQNKASTWSAVSHWQMGLIKKADWLNAQWIGYEKMPDSLKHGALNSERVRFKANDVLPLFRKEFSVQKPIKSATVFICGLGHFELSVNGSKTSDHFLDPGWTNYDKEALYVTFDITKQLKKGSNAIGVAMGNGFYFIPGDRYRKLQLAYGYPKMICRIVVNYEDDTTENIVSDASWKTTKSPVTFSNIYGGEDYDARLEEKGWNTASFHDAHWKIPVVVDGPPRLISQAAAPLKIFDRFNPVKITQPKPGVWVYDLGQNASAIPKITVKGKRGDVIKLWPSELLDTAGLITTKPIGTPVYFTYTLKGDGVETWQPQFMYYGFRYLQVEGAVPAGKSVSSSLPTIVSMQSLHTRNAAESAGSFLCSNDLFNKTNKLIDWAIRSNMSSVLTDCPHREKLGWLEEAHLVGPSIRYGYDIASLCNKIIRDMMQAQTSDGLIPDIAPEYAQFGGGFRDSPEWGSNGIIMPWYVYQWYGDKQVLEESYSMMQRYVVYLLSKAKEGILYHGLGDWYDIGPKEPGPSQLTPQGLTPTAIFYYDLAIMKQVAKLLNKNRDFEYYDSVALTTKTAYNKKFFNTETKQYGSGSQTSNAISVYMNLVEPQYKDAVVANIVNELRNRNNSLTAGDIGYRYLLRVLDDNNRSDVIYDMNSNPSVPGYGYQLAKGATSLTESWQAYTNASNNHMMLGHLMEWFYSGLTGIRPSKNSIAFKEIEIRPQPVGDVTWTKASYQSPYGKIITSWKKNADTFELDVTIPANTTAIIYLPASSTNQSGNIKKVGSGNYHFKVKY